MLSLSAPPTFIFENDARRMNGRYREAASQRSTIKPMAGLGRERQERELLAVELRPSGSIAKREHESEKDRLKPLGLVENLRRSGYSQNVATHQGYTKLYLEMYPTRYGSEIIKESQHVR